MKLPKSFTTVTPLSKTIALSMLVIFPICGFFLGMKYQQLLALNKPQPSVIEYKMLHPTPSPTTPTTLEDGTISCRTKSDCPSNYSCTQAGPIMIDPRTKRTISHLTCWKNGNAVPL